MLEKQWVDIVFLFVTLNKYLLTLQLAVFIFPMKLISLKASNNSFGDIDQVIKNFRINQKWNWKSLKNKHVSSGLMYGHFTKESSFL